MVRRVHVCFDTSSTLRRALSAKLINRVRSSSSPLPSGVGAEVVGEMRPGYLLLPLAAAASAVASSSSSPGDDVPEYVTVAVGEDEAPSSVPAWSPVSEGYEVPSSADGVVDSIGGALLRAAGAVTRTARSLTWTAADTTTFPRRRGLPSERDVVVAGTVFQVVRESGRGRRFAELLDGHEGLRGMLDDPGREVTVFLPADDAMRRLEGLGRADEVSVREMLEYHVLSGLHTLEALRGARAVDTVLEEGGMGRRQRLRIEKGMEKGAVVNFYAQLLEGDSIRTANGILHFVDDVLVPPPRLDKLIGALPERLSAFSEAMRRTAGASPRGGRATVFAPSDEAWKALGAAAEGFLFSDEGAEYLRALVAYHVVADEVVYSDAETLDQRGREFKTLLAGASVVVRRERETGTGEVVMKVDGAEVEVRDVPARDGVVHVLDRVLVPGSHGKGLGEGTVGVEELRRRLAAFVRVDEGFKSGEL